MTRRAPRSLRSLQAVVLWAGATTLAWLAPTRALAQEYRSITLSDERVIIAQVDEMTSASVYVTVPQGRMQVPFAEILALDEISPGEYLDQPDWRVVILPFVTQGPALAADAATLRVMVRDAFESLDRVSTTTPQGLVAMIGEDGVAELDACGFDPSCTVGLARQANATMVAMGALDEREGRRELVVSVAWPDAPTAQSQLTLRLPSDSPLSQAAVNRIVYRVLGLVPPEIDPAGAPPTPEVTPTPETPVAQARTPRAAVTDPTRLRALSFVPLPGAPSAARRDPAGIALSAGIAVPGTALAVMAGGQASMSRAQLIGLSVASYYGFTVFANQAVALRGIADAQLVAAPQPDGGAQVQLVVALEP